MPPPILSSPFRTLPKANPLSNIPFSNRGIFNVQIPQPQDTKSSTSELPERMVSGELNPWGKRQMKEGKATEIEVKEDVEIMKEEKKREDEEREEGKEEGGREENWFSRFERSRRMR
ncbi:hypothetical protein GLAREA_04228 [Glarea lozoyensis ATCC 20868]|uniref:Uncharacterized protein n=1 Tax=Glarea lozoyensis (strain ATCC 20868 / MF5171) TaxID=1116229 RepID=S3CLR6_GLAL2|nr:uncharacterized protein GLAREA_04228 [Glarea lozoyensis ATCC 20868]EPE27437.1 hypothetical protein GLAREA_04228 [Glarea lozoyensis ATCC 20868]